MPLRLCLLLVAILTIALPAADAPDTTAETITRERMVGTWIATVENEGISETFLISRAADGTLSVTTRTVDPAAKRFSVVTDRGTWSLDHRVLNEIYEDDHLVCLVTALGDDELRYLMVFEGFETKSFAETRAASDQLPPLGDGFVQVEDVYAE